MKKISLILYTAIVISTTVFAMENNLSVDFLLKNEAQQLQQLLTIESKGNFSQELLTVEKTLLDFFEINALENIINRYSKNTIALARSISQRPTARKEFSIILNNDDTKALEGLIKSNPYILNGYNSAKDTLLHQAVRLEKPQCIALLLDKKANPNCYNAEDNSPLHIAVKTEVFSTIISNLLEAGADPNIKNKENKSPFDIVCARNSPNIKAFEPYGYLFFSSLWPYKNPFILLKNNADYFYTLAQQPLDSYEWHHAAKALTTFFYHIKKYASELSLTKRTAITTNDNFTLYRASLDQCIDLFQDRTLKTVIENIAGVIKYKQEVKKLLLVSAYHGNYDKLDEILQRYPISNNLQYEILKTCIQNHHHKCLSLCLKYHFNPNRYHQQQSLLHFAIDYTNPQAIQILSDYNADLTILNQAEQTPLDYAISIKKTKCIIAITIAIEKRKDALLSQQGHCGLSKHLFGSYKKTGFCEECIGKLGWQLQFHSEYLRSIA